MESILHDFFFAFPEMLGAFRQCLLELVLPKGHISARETEAHEKLQAAEKMAEDGDIVVFACAVCFQISATGGKPGG